MSGGDLNMVVVEGLWQGVQVEGVRAPTKFNRFHACD